MVCPTQRLVLQRVGGAGAATAPPFTLLDGTLVDSIGSFTHISELFGLGTLVGSNSLRTDRTHTFVGYEQLLMPVSSLTDPTLENALDLLETGFERGGMLTLVGRCEVNYDGRAASHLPPGERLVITKPDGTLLVHRGEQRTPVNWQPPGCHHNACIKNDSLILQSTRTSPHEEVEISFKTLAQVTLLELDDPPDLALEGSEEDLRQRILANPDLLGAGFQPLMTERETTAGAVDIYGKDADGTPTIVELKPRRVGPDAVGQLNRYVDALKRDLAAGRSVRGLLVAPSVTEQAQKLLTTEELEFVSLTAEGADTSQPTRFTEFSDESRH